jgi:two-component system sensor histidine kinase VanS
LSVRLKLTLSYAGFLMLAGAVLLVVGYFSLSRGVHPGVIFMVRSHADLLRAFAPTAAIVMAFLLVFGLLGGWLLAGRMLAPLTRITDATRTAASGSLSHRIELEGHQDEFRELADSFDAMLARLEAHVAEQQRFAANASHELRTPLAVTQTLLDVARNDPNRDNGELVDRLHAVNARAIDLTEALLLLSRADRRSFTREHVDLSLIAEEATETLLTFAENRGLAIETSGDPAAAIGSHALLLLSTNLVHNAIVHNLPEEEPWVTTSVHPKGAVLTIENTGATLAPQVSPRLPSRFFAVATHTHRPQALASAWQSSKHHPSTRRNPHHPRPPAASASPCNYPPRHRSLSVDDQGNFRTPRNQLPRRTGASRARL